MVMQQQAGHSAEVEMQLLLNGYTLPISHMGPGHIRLRQPTQHPPAEAEIVLMIDGHESKWRVMLPEGLRLDHERIPTKRIE